MKAAARLFAFATLALVLVPAAHAAHDWTAVTSTGAIDSTSLGIYFFNGAVLTFPPGSGSLGTIVARYNVTNTFDNNANPDMPGWTTLEFGYSNPGAFGAVNATLFQVDPCNGAQVTLCTVNALAGATNTCSTCTFTAAMDFSRHLYYVLVRITRPASTVTASANSLRIF
ncbi:MAG TPA: hypothetical protein VOA87_19275 [Thermoanaerobaculia bacterium]|nr:hypothetical protein [Thermoanaerobaculia bacterium]